MKKKTILSTIVLLVIFIIVIVVLGYALNFFPALTSNPSKNGQSTNPPYSPTIPTSSAPPVSPFTIITFNFDKGTPAVNEGLNTPFTQTSGEVTAYFSSPSDPSTFSIQSYVTTFYTLSQFSGNYLFDNKIVRDKLDISFSQPMNNISLTFATAEYYGSGHVEEPSIMKITAYMDNTNTIIGSATAQGVVSNNIFPQGTLSFDAMGQSFNLVRIEMLFQQPGGTDFLVDNITVSTAP